VPGAAWLALGALVATGGIAVAVLAWRSSSDGKEALTVSAETGVRGVGFGASEDAVRRVFGEPAGGEGYFPEGESYTGPPGIPSPDGTRPRVLRYEDVAFLLSHRGVFSFMVTAGEAVTPRGIGVGDSLDSARRAYSMDNCGKSTRGEPLFGGPPPTYRWCRTILEDGAHVFFGNDPIESITFTRLGSQPASR
jgi:hypothetical protein